MTYTNARLGNEHLRKICERAGLEYVPEYNIKRLNQKIDEAEKTTRNQAQPATTSSKPTNAPAVKTSLPNTRDTIKLAACYLAAFGQAQYSAIVNQHGNDAFDYMERGLFYGGLNIPGYDFSSASRHGAAKPPFGFRRIETAERQARIDACLSRLK